MRKLVGTILVLYSLLLGFSVSLPLIASIAGAKVSAITVTDPATCHEAIGFAPLGGFPPRCDVTWTTEEGEATGTLYGEAADNLAAGANTPQTAVHQLGNFALTAPIGGMQLVMAFAAVPILFIGLQMFANKRRRGRRGGGGSGSDYDDDDYGDDGGDSGGDGGGDGGGGGD